METGLQRSNEISIINLKTFTMSGVVDIAGFDGDYILLDTTAGRISIEGRDLKIESLTKDGGVILVVGDISGVYVTPIKEKKRSLFSRFID